MRCAAFLAAAGLLLCGCTSTQVSFTPTDKARAFEARAADYPIEVFEGDQAPTRPYDEVGVLNVHLEATSFITYSMKDALPLLKAKARTAGADAIMAVRETRGRYLETSMYNLSCKAIRYRK